MRQQPKTPVTDQALNELTRTEKERIAERDRGRLDFERSQVSPDTAAKMTTPTHSISNMFREWESMIDALESDWKGPDYFMIDDYLFALDVRTALGKTLNHMLPNTPHLLAEALEALDRRFLDHTIQEEPGGAGVLEPYLRNMAADPPDWLWNRRPRIIPW